MPTRIWLIALPLLLGTPSFLACQADEPEAAGDPTGRREVVVTLTLPGASALEMETSVALPVEAALLKSQNAKRIECDCREGQVVVRVLYATERDRDLIAISRRLRLLSSELPSGVEIDVLRPTLRPGLWLTATSPRHSPDELLASIRELATTLKRLPHVDHVEVLGGRPSEYCVQCDPERLVAYRLSLPEVLKAIEQAAVAARGDDRESLEGIELKSRGKAAVHLRDIAEVRLAPAPRSSMVTWNSEAAVAIGLYVRTESAAQEVRSQILEQLPKWREFLPQDAKLSLGVGREHAALLALDMYAPLGAAPERLFELTGRLERSMKPLAAEGVLTIWNADDPSLVQVLATVPRDEQAEEKLRDVVQSELVGLRARIAKSSGLPAAWRPQYDVELTLAGEDLEQLARWSSTLASRLRETAGVVEVFDEAADAPHEIQMTILPDARLKHDLDAAEIHQAILAGTTGIVVDRGTDEVRVRVRTAPDDTDLRSLVIPNVQRLVPLTELVDLSLARAPRVHRRDGQRIVRVTAMLPEDSTFTANRAKSLAQQIHQEMNLSDECSVSLD